MPASALRLRRQYLELRQDDVVAATERLGARIDRSVLSKLERGILGYELRDDQRRALAKIYRVPPRTMRTMLEEVRQAPKAGPR